MIICICLFMKRLLAKFLGKPGKPMESPRILCVIIPAARTASARRIPGVSGPAISQTSADAS